MVGFKNDTVVSAYGTWGWMAPEAGEHSTFSPLRADRWSRGKVLLYFLKVQRAESFAEQVMDDDPLHRPSLVDWFEQVGVMLCDDDDTE
ncbi:hypothetical protein F5148DRAFT_495199 [Russula earlei]|uniref:Uncharacterized protein n=1 Tax=Russula earlei TaxID=71964 RepID=A0ACC0TYP6_9AGAM|nr:hypothetical protein F5148DRAFT_495199 [Russula earlei]